MWSGWRYSIVQRWRSVACVSGIRIQFANRCIFSFKQLNRIFFIVFIIARCRAREQLEQRIIYSRWLDQCATKNRQHADNLHFLSHFISIFITQLEERSCHRHRRRRRLQINYVHSLFEFFSISSVHTVSIAPLLTHNLHFMILFFSAVSSFFPFCCRCRCFCGFACT